MFETSRRRFLLGLGEAGVLAATPVRLVSGLPKLEVGDAVGKFTDIRDLSKSILGDLRARVVGPIHITNYAPHGYLPAFDGGDITFTRSIEALDSYLDFRGWIKEEIWDKHINCEPVKAYIKLPLKDRPHQFICADFRIDHITVGAATL